MPEITHDGPTPRGSNSDSAVGNGPARHPAGLWVLFITEMWERFSYYGMRALLVLYLVAGTTRTAQNDNPGFGWEEGDAYLLYGVYTFMVYVTSIFGGMVADRFFGTNRSMLFGGTIIALGHITLALTELFAVEPGLPVTMRSSPGALVMFLSGLALIIVGTGFFKPCASVMVGQLYGAGDPRRDSGFTIFYMGINLGAFLSPLVAGALGEGVGWHWGFGSAAVGMVVGLVFYSVLRPRYLEGVGEPPPVAWTRSDGLKFAGLFAVMVGIPVVPLLLYTGGGLAAFAVVWDAITATPVHQLGLWSVLLVLLVGSIWGFLLRQRPEERSRLAVVFILAFLGNIAFWTAYEQAGSSMNIFAKVNTDRTFLGWTFPASYFQSVNPLAILVFGPVFAWLWVFLGRRKLEPSTPLKFVAGLYLLGLAFVAMVLGAMKAEDGTLVSPIYLLTTYVVYTWGELCLSPVGLSMVTKLSPARLQSVMMGLWFFSLALSNLCAGLVARISVKFKGDNPELSFVIDGLPGFYLLLVVAALAMGTLLLLLSPVLRRMMGGVH